MCKSGQINNNYGGGFREFDEKPPHKKESF